MKNILRAISIFILIQVLSTQIISAQIVKTIGAYSSCSESYPINTNSDYGFSYTIYDASEIGSAGYITKIEYLINNNCNISMNNQKIYLLNTSSTYLSMGNITSPTSMGATLVYDGTITWNGSGWKGINLQNSFFYNGTDNLMVLLENRDGNTQSNYTYFYYSLGNTKKTKYSFFSSFPTNGMTTSNRPIIRFTINPYSSNDLSITNWLYPNNGNFTNASMHISLNIKNLGSSSQNNYTVKYSIDNGNTWVSKNQTASLASNTSTIVSFNQTTNLADMSTPGIYNCIAVVNNLGDTITNNDTIRKNIILCNGSYSGNYIIGNDTAADFPDLASAFRVFNSCGVSGPITLKVESGTYHSQLIIPPISGITTSNPLTIESLSGNADDVIFKYSTNSPFNNYVLKINKSNSIIIKNITFISPDYNYNCVVNINSSNNVVIDNCTIIGSNTSSPSHNSNALIINAGNNNTSNNITISNNKIIHGNNGIKFFNNNSFHGNNIKIINNKIKDFYNHGIYLNEYDSINITNNNIISSFNTTGIKIKNSSNGFLVSKNKVSIKKGDCISFSYCTGSSGNPNKINNNFLILQNGYNNSSSHFSSIVFTFSNFTEIDFNSINIIGSNSLSYGVHIYSSDSIKMRNNNIINNASGLAIKTYSSSSIVVSDYNNYYTSGSYLAHWNGAHCTNISCLKTQSGKELHSISNNTSFYLNDNLHTASTSIIGQGTPVSGITEDFDGQLRDNISPNIGADEYKITQNDAGLLNFEDLLNVCNGATKSITVKLKNFGSNTISSMIIAYSINDTNYGPIIWNGTLASSNTTNLTLGNHIFNSNNTYKIKAWIGSVNMVNDSNKYNDTITNSEVHTSLTGGTYVVGNSSTADFNSLSSAINTIKKNGICGPIVLNIEDGTYIGQYNIYGIKGLDNTNNITIKSLSNNANNVILKYDVRMHDFKYILKIENSNYINIKNISFSAVDNVYPSNCIRIYNSNNINIDSCNFFGKKHCDNNLSNSFISAYIANRIHIKHNYFKSGSGAVDISSESSNLCRDIKIQDNTISEFNGNAIHLNNVSDSINITKNTITDYCTSNSSGIYCNFNNSSGKGEISYNKISIIGQITSNGIQILNHSSSGGLNSNKIKIYNNFISINNSIHSNSLHISLINIKSSNYIDIYNNTLRFKNITYQNCFAISVYDISHNNIKNNIIDAENKKILSIVDGFTTYYDNTFDYNSYYSTNTNPFHYQNSDYNFQTYKQQSGFDANSKYIQPIFFGISNLHLHDTIIDSLGTPISYITDDIDGEIRNTSTPDIGADEFDIFPNDAQLYAIYQPSPIVAIGTMSIKISLRNMGTNNLTSDSIYYQLDNNTPMGYLWTGNLTPLDIDDHILIGTQTITAGNHTLKVWSSKPNNTTDFTPYNDTISLDLFAQLMPNITLNPDIISATINNCNDSVTIPINIINNGSETLHFVEKNSGKIQYDSTSEKITINSGSSTIHTFSGISSNTDTLILTITINGDNTSTYNYVTIYVDSVYLGIFQGGTYKTDVSKTYTLTGTVLNNYLSDGTLEVKIVNSSFIYDNIHKVNIHSTGGKWLFNYHNSIDSVPPNDTTTLYYTFKSSGLSQGIYTGNINIMSDDLGNPYVNIPCTLNVQNQLAGGVSLGNDTSTCSPLILNAGVFNSYSWNTGDTTQTLFVVNSGAYSVTVGNGNCTASDTIAVSINPLPPPPLNSDTSICGGSIVIDADTISPYLWNTGDTTQTLLISNSGLYIVTIGSGYCTTTDSINITINPIPTPNLGPDTSICGSSSILLDAGAGFTNYLWSTGEISQTITVDSTGIGFDIINVIVQVTDTLLCSGTNSINITFQNCVGMNDVDKNIFTIAVYPNPNNGQFVIESNTTAVKEVEMNITDINGRLIIHKQLKNTSGAFKEMIDLRNEAKGVYFIKLSNNGVNKVFKVIIQ